MNLKSISLVFVCISALLFSACNRNQNTKTSQSITDNKLELKEILETQNLNEKQRYSIINQLASSYRIQKD